MFRLSAVLMLVATTTLVAQTPAPPLTPRPVPPPRTPVAAIPPLAPTPAPVAAGDLDRLRAISDAYADMSNDYADRALANVDLSSINEQVAEAMSNANLARDFGGWQAGPIAWDRQDPADSLYREARDLLNRGDYRKAADLFKALPQRYPTSVYVGDAEYWQAFSLYRIGGTPELQEALGVLAARKPDDTTSRVRVRRDESAPSVTTNTSTNVSVRTSPKAPKGYDVAASNYSYSYGGRYSVDVGGRRGVDAAGLAARIASVLSSRGLAGDPAVKHALAAGGNACDPDDQSVRAEALNALMQNDPAMGRQMAVKILANHDDCSVPLRRNAVMIVGNQRDAASVTALAPVAKSDPSESVRLEAMQFLVQNGSDAAVSAVIDLAQTAGDAAIQRDAIEALARSPNPRATAALRAVVGNNGADESLRAAALEGMNSDRLTADDATWLRGVYASSTSPRVKERIIELISRAGGPANTDWVMSIVRDDSQSLELRSEALDAAGHNLDVAALGHMYDTSPQRPIRQQVIALLAQREEPAAVDKLVDIARHGTDPAMRREAIAALARSKDPRASQLLLQLVDDK